MPERLLPRYPIYIPSKGRWEAKQSLTANALARDGVPFRLVVEPQERDHYLSRFRPEHILVLPFQNAGSSVPARNWIKQHSTAHGDERHWQLDDNMRGFVRWWRGKRVNCDSAIALRVCEDFTDRYENIAISGLNYEMFGMSQWKTPPFFHNVHVYSCTLVLNRIPFEWRGRYNEDTDICLQALSAGWCTVLINAFLARKAWTMTMKGGNTDRLYRGDGRLKMARSLERVWPGVVETRRRWQRPQHVVRNQWRGFDTPLKPKPGVVITPGIDEYGLALRQVRSEIRSERLKSLVSDRLETS